MTFHKAFMQSEESQGLLSHIRPARHPVLDLVDEQTLAGKRFSAFIMGLIICNVFLFFATTTEPFYQNHKWSLEIFEFISVLIFMAEYSLRMYVAPEKDETMTPTMARVMFATSFYGIVDLMGFLPYLLTLLVPSDHVSLAVVRILRLLMLFRAEGQYFEAFTLFDDVFCANANMLKVTGFTGLVVWIFISTFNYLAERSNKALDGKYGTMFSSSWWTLVNLNGNFPINDELTTWGKLIACGTVVVAVGVFAIPTGILGAGLKDIYDQKREAEQEEEDKSEGAVSTEICNECKEQQLCSAPIQERIWYHMEGHSKLGRMIDYFMLVLILLNVLAFSLSTIPSFHHETALAYFEAISVLIFTVEFGFNVYSCVADPRFSGSHGRWRYITSFYGIVDLCAILPWWVDIIYPGDLVPTTFLRALRLAKLLRADIETFSLFGDVYHLQKDMIMTTAFMGLVLWVCFAALMHFAERHNPDPEVRDEFQSGAGTAWIILLNLSGEYPLANYTLLGRLLSFVSFMCAIGVFAIPTGIFADGFEQVLNQRAEEAEKRAKNPPACAVCHRDVDEVNGVAKAVGIDEEVDEVIHELKEEALTIDDIPSTTRGQWFLLFNVDTETGQRVDQAMMAIITFNIVCFILSTEQSIMKGHPGLQTFFDVVEWITMILFTAEYSLRLWTCPENPNYQRDCYCWGNPYLQHIFSFYSIVDLLAILPFWVDVLLPSVTIGPTTIFRIFRLIELLKGEKYAPAFTLLDNVFAAKRVILVCTGVVACVLTVVFATLLHYAEHDNETKVEGLTMAERFVDVPHALFYTMLHLTGSYPVYQYTCWGRFINFFIIVIAAGLVGLPTGAIAGGFQSLIEGMRTARAKQSGHNDDEPPQINLGHLDNFCRPCRVREASKVGFQAQVYIFLQGDTMAGAFFIKVLMSVIVLDIIAFAIQTDKFLAQEVGPTAFHVIDMFSGLLFTAEYIMRIYAAPQDVDYPSRFAYATSFLAMVDLAAVLPFYTGLFFGKISGWSMVLRSFRLIRLLKFEHYVEAFTIFDNVLVRSHAILVTTSLAAAIIWVGSSTLFWVFESSNPLMEGKFSSIPLSMFYTLLILGREWAVCDFTVWGQLLGVVMCVAGVGLFAVPTGILYSGFQDMLAKRREVQEQQRKGLVCAGCGGLIRHFLHHRTQDD